MYTEIQEPMMDAAQESVRACISCDLLRDSPHDDIYFLLSFSSNFRAILSLRSLASNLVVQVSREMEWVRVETLIFR